MYFMHLKGERPMVYWPLGLTAFLFVGLLVALLLAEGDHLFGTQFGDAFTTERDKTRPRTDGLDGPGTKDQAGPVMACPSVSAVKTRRCARA